MNKQRYLAELQRLLVFMTDEDRDATVRRYAELFDAAGPEGEEMLIAELGSPTKTAIGLSRGYEPGQIPETEAEQRAFGTLSEKKPDEPWEELPAFELPELVPEEDSAKSEASEKPEAPAPRRAEPVRPVRQPRPAPEEPWREPQVVIERSMPLGLGVPLFILVMLALGLPLAALCLALMAVCAAPGCALLFGAYLVAVGGMWCMSYMADMILLFGLAFAVLAVGLLVLWGGVWLIAKLGGLYAAGVRWLAGELLGRKVTVDDE